MPAIYRVSQKFVPLLYKSVMRYDWSLVRKSRRQIVKLTIVPSFDSNIRFLYFRAKGEWARVYFSATYFFAFFNSLNSPNCSNSLCFLWISWKFNPLKTKTCSHVRAFKKRVFFDLLAYQLKKLLKNWKNPNVGWENHHGEMKVLKATKKGNTESPHKAANVVLKKARYKIGNSTRKLSQQFASQV